ncbi:alpha/beta hydrolase family protein [Nonomuraea gerenzanensis]|uniref:Lipase (Secreted protein) n=1 Tax=Nonomuraea gerenzanensis TaxID=93944 RepID=A0A1M4DYY4_9ACTN|nr:alpha/beta hydrolase [Nonomuraea gerenzanensis]UBU14070.1 alpha/beta hydrolase [Nonomuraea gerenzanensis]SBO91761.1 lipase (secreted protein) [Nonomuraea gerenzanensis]
MSAGPALPEPTGSKPIGTTTLHLIDKSRPDPWNPEADRRELLVSLWYPAKKATGAATAPYLTAQESELVLKGLPVAQKDVLTKVRTHARPKAPAAGGKRPLVVMSPGFSFPRATLTSLAEDFASRGYLVAAVEHTYESVATTFPDGRTTTCLACVDGQDHAKVAESRARDVRFVLDELTKGDWGRRIDRSRIAMVGHSIGGYSAAQAMLADGRIKAGVNLDGTFRVEKPLKRPFMLIGAPKSHAPGGTDESWKQAWPNLDGWKRWITVKGTDHSAFVDYAVLRPQLGLPAQELDGMRALEITRAHLAGFLDRHLLGKRTPVKDYPEVTVHNP